MEIRASGEATSSPEQEAVIPYSTGVETSCDISTSSPEQGAVIPHSTLLVGVETQTHSCDTLSEHQLITNKTKEESSLSQLEGGKMKDQALDSESGQECRGQGLDLSPIKQANVPEYHLHHHY